jgi:hypothetical protein
MKAFLEKKIGIILLIGIILTILSPFLFTRQWGIIDFTETGNIGSTIGGITAPFTSLLGAILIYFALVAQRQANKIQSQNSSTQSLLTLIIDLESKCQNLVFTDDSMYDRKGIAAFNSIGCPLYLDRMLPYMGEKNDKFKNDLMVVVNFGDYFNTITNASVIFDFIESSDIDNFNKKILRKRFNHIYTIYFQHSLRKIEEFYAEEKNNINTNHDKYIEEIISFRNKVLSAPNKS